MIHNNILFTKESLKEAISTIGKASYTLIYDGNDTQEQITAGKELLQAKWILATISDHIFDYYPLSYFMNKDDKENYPEFWDWFMQHPKKGINNAIRFVEDNFCVLETVTRDEYNQHRLPKRNVEREEHAREVLQEISLNLHEILGLLKGPKNNTDPGKPSEREIKNLIETINKVQKQYSDLADQRGDNEFSLQVFQFSKTLDMFKNPLLLAWEVYRYGWHSDFWEEGDSMFEYILFSSQAKEMITELIKLLEEQSPFEAMERNSMITNGLLHVYRHLLTQDLSNI